MEDLLQQIQASSWTPPWLAGIRQKAFARFQSQGWPTRSEEDWRYTSTKALSQENFLTELPPLSFDASWRSLYLGDAYRLVFVNGRYIGEESLLSDKQGVHLSPLESSLDRLQSGIEPFLQAKEGESSLHALNQALFNSGAYLRLERGVKLDRPLQLLYIQDGRADSPALISPRLFVHLAEGAEATLLESYVGKNAGTFSNSVSTVRLEANAQLLHLNENILSPGSLALHQAHYALKRDAKLKTFTFNLGGQLNRAEQRIELQEPGAHAQFDGLYCGRQKNHIDFNSTVLHQAPQTTSSQVYKGILYDQSRSVFDGKITILKNAQQVRAEQLNKNLLMSSEAEVDTKPQLKIDADDVKCSHGATIGRLDRNELFYLQSRGIDKQSGEQMLSQAFVRDVVGRLGHQEFELRLLGSLESFREEVIS